MGGCGHGPLVVVTKGRGRRVAAGAAHSWREFVLRSGFLLDAELIMARRGRGAQVLLSLLKYWSMRASRY